MADFEPAYRSRPGAEAMVPAVPDEVFEVVPGIWCSPGLSNVYLLPTADGRVVINAGMGFEGPVHRANLDSIDSAPVAYVILTQGHYDHVGGLDSVRDPDTKIVAQANWSQWRDDNERLARYRISRSAFAFSDTLATGIARIQERFGRKLPGQSTPAADIVVEDGLTLRVGERTLELIATPGGETTDSMVVWLPDERICLCGNVFGALFGHMPNLVTMRGDRYRDALTVIETIERVRALAPEVLLTGHFAPITGGERIQFELTRLRDAVQYVHDATVEGMTLKVVTKRAPSETELNDLRFAFRVAKHVKSNTIVYAKDLATVGIGAGQMSRVDSARIAARKAEDAAKELKLDVPMTKGSVVASDAFFPFADGLLVAIEAGATAVIQPGGSMRDAEVIAAADEHGVAMVFTGTRHFRH